MGEISDMTIDGTLDEQTGEYIDGTSPGYPRTMYGRRYSNKPPIQPEFMVVMNFLQQMGVEGQTNKKRMITAFTKQTGRNAAMSHSGMSKIIRKTPESWIEFKTWLYTTYPQYSPKPQVQNIKANDGEREDSAGEQLIQDILDNY